MPETFYDILGVSSQASHEEIKQAYKKCARECHPDKCRDDPTSTERMKKVNIAFETLGDPERRRTYDAFGFGNASGYDWILLSNIIKKFALFVSDFKAKAAASTTNDVKQAVKDQLKIDLVVTLEEICKSPPVIKKIAIKVLRFSEDDEKKRVFERKNLYVSLLNYQDSYIFEDEGDEIQPGKYGDVCVKLLIKPHEHYHIDSILNPHDLHFQRAITLHEYFYGFTEVVKHIDGKSQFCIEYKTGMKTQKINGMGIPFKNDNNGEVIRGDLYVFFELILPLSYKLKNGLLDDENVKQVISRLSHV